MSEYLESDGSAAVHYEYSLFGRLTLVDSETGAPYFNHRFSTKFFDTETRLYYYGFRYYSSELGRWVSRDPIGELGGKQLFGFVLNNPISLHDPDGRLGKDDVYTKGSGVYLNNRWFNDEYIGRLQDGVVILFDSSLKLELEALKRIAEKNDLISLHEINHFLIDGGDIEFSFAKVIPGVSWLVSAGHNKGQIVEEYVAFAVDDCCVTKSQSTNASRGSTTGQLNLLYTSGQDRLQHMGLMLQARLLAATFLRWDLHSSSTAWVTS